MYQRLRSYSWPTCEPTHRASCFLRNFFAPPTSFLPPLPDQTWPAAYCREEREESWIGANTSQDRDKYITNVALDWVKYNVVDQRKYITNTMLDQGKYITNAMLNRVIYKTNGLVTPSPMSCMSSSDTLKVVLDAD